MEFYPLDEFPIDSLPVDMSKKITLYTKPIESLIFINIRTVLNFGTYIYEILLKRCNDSEDDTLNSLYFTADTGYIVNYDFSPNDSLIETIRNHPEIAISDLDKALLGCIYLAKLCVRFKDEIESEIDLKEFLYGFIYFFHNVQKYELKNHRTIDLNSKKLNKHVIDIFLNPDCKISSRKQIKLSNTEVMALTEALEYRKKLVATLIEIRQSEKEYAQSEENQYYWKLFLKCVNFRVTEEQRVLELIFQDVDIVEKNQAFSSYFEGLKAIDSSLTSSEISLEELAKKINDRFKKASNYSFANNDKGELVQIDNSIFSILCLPISFDCVLIAYHAFLLKPTKESLKRLVSYIYIYITRNISQIDKLPDSLGNDECIEESIVELYELINAFYVSHKSSIDNYDLQFKSILKEETLSGFSFEDDIDAQLMKCQQDKFIENYRAFDDLKEDERNDYFTQVREYLRVGNVSGFESETRNLANKLPNPKTDFETLKEHEICKRLVFSINAIYVLAETIGRMIDLKLVNEGWQDKLICIKSKLYGFEDFLVRHTYVPPKTFYDYEFIKQYRLNRGIDATDIEKGYKKAFNSFILERSISAIKELRVESDNMTFEKASEIKEKLRNEINDIPEYDLKKFIFDVVDEVSLCLTESLIRSNSGTEEFIKSKESICNYIGDSSNILPEKAITALATAELLFSKYAFPEYARLGFDYSCISVLYYQAVEVMYNELIWRGYSEKLYKIRVGDDWFSYCYRFNKLPEEYKIYLPIEDQFKCWDKEKKRISDHLTMGSFNILLETVTSNSDNRLIGFRKHMDIVFGYSGIHHNNDEYKEYQKKLDELYIMFKTGKDRRNAASHGQNLISLDECKVDKKLVLSDVESIRKNSLGMVLLFLSLYRKKRTQG